MPRLAFAAIAVVGLIGLSASAVEAGTILVSGAARGWYLESGTANGSSAINNFTAGDCRGACGGTAADVRNWFTFDVSGLAGTVVSARQLLDTHANPDGFYSDGITET